MDAPWRLLLVVAGLTGTASFIYEIGWIRMLSLVLGAATHSFELMLSAFILGLACGGLWVRGRIDRTRSPLRLPRRRAGRDGPCSRSRRCRSTARRSTLMQLADPRHRQAPTRATRSFNVAGHGIALADDVPGRLLRRHDAAAHHLCAPAGGHGERAIGAVYAANTLGAIVGVVFAAHLGMPLLGLKGLIIAGAALDVALGLVLLWRLAVAGQTRTRAPRPVGQALPGGLTLGLTLAAIAALVIVGFAVSLDPYKMAAGVFRRGDLYSAQDAELKFYRDGKTDLGAPAAVPRGALATHQRQVGRLDQPRGRARGSPTRSPWCSPPRCRSRTSPTRNAWRSSASAPA